MEAKDWFKEGNDWLEKGDYSKALDCYEKVIELKSDDVLVAFAYSDKGNALYNSCESVVKMSDLLQGC